MTLMQLLTPLDGGGEVVGSRGRDGSGRRECREEACAGVGVSKFRWNPIWLFRSLRCSPHPSANIVHTQQAITEPAIVTVTMGSKKYPIVIRST